jgi:hypothetical protein
MRTNFSDCRVSPFSVSPARLRASHLPLVSSSWKRSPFRSTPPCKPGTYYRSPVLLSVCHRTQEVSRHFHVQWRGTPSRRNPGSNQSPPPNFAAKPSGNLVASVSHFVQQCRLFQQPEVATFACSLTNLVNDCCQSPETIRKIGANFMCIRNRTPFKTVQGKTQRRAIRRGARLASKLIGNSSNTRKPRRQSYPLRKYFKKERYTNDSKKSTALLFHGLASTTVEAD